MLVIAMANKLTDKQDRFVEEYLVDLNATQAAIRAGYSEKTAKEMAHENLTKPHIRNAISEKRKALSEKTGVTAERVINELALVAFANMHDYMDIDEKGLPVIDWATLTRKQAAAMSEVTTEVTASGAQKTKFKLHSKMNALDLLGKHFGLFITKFEHTGPDGGPMETTYVSEKELARLTAYLLLEADDRLPTNTDKTGNNGATND